MDQIPSIPVRIHHPATGNQLGEKMIAHQLDKDIINFELLENPGKCLRVDDKGRVEFSSLTDDSTVFISELTPSGTMYLKCRNYTTKTNATGAQGWYLALTKEGKLKGNAGRSQNSQWFLIPLAEETRVSTARSPTITPARTSLPTKTAAATGKNIVFAQQLNGNHNNNNNNSSPQPSPHEDSLNHQQQQQQQQQHQEDFLSPQTIHELNGDAHSQHNGQHNGSIGEDVVPTVDTNGKPSTSSREVEVKDQTNSNNRDGRLHVDVESYNENFNMEDVNFDLAVEVMTEEDPELLIPPGFKAPVEEQMRWLATSTGQGFLKSYPRFLHLYKAGKLESLLHRPDWPKAGIRLGSLSISHLQYLVGQVAMRWKDPMRPLPTINRSIAASILSKEKKQFFFENGFVQLNSVVPAAVTHNALRTINFWLGSRNQGCVADETGHMALSGGISSDPDIMALLYQSPLAHVLQTLLAPVGVEPPGLGEVVLRYPCLGDTPEAVSGIQWRIEGFQKDSATQQYSHSPYTLLVAVALSDMKHEFAGNLCVYPESLYTLQEAVRQQVEEQLTVFSDENTIHKPHLGSPKQLILRRGDVVLCTQKLAITESMNFGSNIRYMVYFRVSVMGHEANKEAALTDMWIEYEAL